MRVMEHLVNERDEALRWSILVGKQKHNVQKPNYAFNVIQSVS